MLIYKDVFTGDEVCSDAYPKKDVEGVIMEVTGKYEVRKQGAVILAGSNPSAEGDPEDEGVDDETTERGIDIVLNHRLSEDGFFSDIKNFKSYIKDQMKKLADHLKKKGTPDDKLKEWQKKMTEWVTGLISKERFGNLKFFVGERMGEGEREGGTVIICEYRDIDGQEKPIFMYIKAGIEEEKI